MPSPRTGGWPPKARRGWEQQGAHSFGDPKSSQRVHVHTVPGGHSLSSPPGHVPIDSHSAQLMKRTHTARSGWHVPSQKQKQPSLWQPSNGPPE
jgi:hypothetical protein